VVRAIISTLAYVRRGDDVLLVHRLRNDDDHVGKYNGLGGKLEPGEDALACVVREVREEAGLEVTSATFRGSVFWPGFGSDVDDFDGEPPARNDDGPLAWFPVDAVDDLPMWEGDAFFLPLVLDDDPRPFHAVLPYSNGEFVRDGAAVSRL